VRYSSGTKQTNYGFTGQYSDSYINLLWYGSRHYDPELGRFIQPDSIIPGPSNPQAYDRYSYVFNNPIRYNDPSGHAPDPVIPGPCLFCAIGSSISHAIRQTIAEVLGVDQNAHDIWELMGRGLLQEDRAYLVGPALEKVQQDPASIKKQAEILLSVKSNPSYKVEDFSPNGSITKSLTFGEHGSFLADARDETTWMLRAANITGSNISVNKKGDINITFTVDDNLDLRPDWGGSLRTGWRGFMYNAITTVTGGVWHDGLGASDTMKTYATWETTIYAKDHPWEGR
jgi:RHS repeat-associated protein